MVKLSTILTIPNKPQIPLLFFPFLNYKTPKVPILFPNFLFTFGEQRKMATKITAEYAKSGRSSCKKCGKAIASQALRLGLVNRDARGFDMTKWHHLACFPDKIDSLDVIEGFDLLKDVDQAALKKLVDETDKPQERGKYELEKSNAKKIKLSMSDEKAELAFSVFDVKDKYKLKGLYNRFLEQVKVPMQDATLKPKWKAFQTIIFLERDDGLNDSSKIAAFDFDGCLAKTSVKRVGADAWSLMYPSIPKKLQRLYEEGFKLVIFTNESNIERWKNKRQVAVDSKIGRLNNFLEQVKVPMQIFIACGIGSSGGKADDPFRKPNPGMWHIMEKHFNSGIPIDMDQSFYVGDAAGRQDDHSDADIKFAQAIGLKFHVPEEYFST